MPQKYRLTWRRSRSGAELARATDHAEPLLWQQAAGLTRSHMWRCNLSELQCCLDVDVQNLGRCVIWSAEQRLHGGIDNCVADQHVYAAKLLHAHHKSLDTCAADVLLCAVPTARLASAKALPMPQSTVRTFNTAVPLRRMTTINPQCQSDVRCAWKQSSANSQACTTAADLCFKLDSRQQSESAAASAPEERIATCIAPALLCRSAAACAALWRRGRRCRNTARLPAAASALLHRRNFAACC